MVRDWNTLQKVLEAVEAERLCDVIDGYDKAPVIAVKPFLSDEDIFCGHVLLAVDAGLIVGFSLFKQGHAWRYFEQNVRLTMQGHELLDSLRSGTVIKKAMEMAKEAAIPLSVELIKAALVKVVAGI